MNTLKISFSPLTQEKPFQVMFVGIQQQKKQNKLKTRERKGQDQDATKIMVAPAESCIKFPQSVMPISMIARTWMMRSIPNRNTIEDFTKEIDEAELICQTAQFLALADEIVVSKFGSYEHFAWCFPSHSLDTPLTWSLMRKP